MYQTFAQWKYRFNENWTVNGGFHYTYFTLDGQNSLEPRLSLQWKVNAKNTLSFATGLHSKPEHISFYFIEESSPDGIRTAPNQDLKLMKSAHTVLGYDLNISSDMRLKLEAYYQHLYDVPVEMTMGSTTSILNASDVWDIIGADEAVNEGTGRNYGLDLTLEKFFTKQYYFLVTGSLFDSRYTPINGEEYSTRFNSNYQVNASGRKGI